MSQFNDTGYSTLTLTADTSQFIRVSADGSIADSTTRDAGITTRFGKAGTPVTICLPSKSGTQKAVASEAISSGAKVYCADNGKVSASGTIPRGVALEAATGDGSVFEIMSVAFSSDSVAASFSSSSLVHATDVYTINASNVVFAMGANIQINTAQADTTKEVLFGHVSDAHSNRMLRVLAYHNADSTYSLRISYANTGFTEINGTTNFNIGQMYRVWLVQRAIDDRSLYVDKSEEISDTTSRAQPTIDTFAIGGVYDTTPSYANDLTANDVQFYAASVVQADIDFDFDNKTSYMHDREASSVLREDLILSWQDGAGNDTTGYGNNGTTVGTEDLTSTLPAPNRIYDPSGFLVYSDTSDTVAFSLDKTTEVQIAVVAAQADSGDPKTFEIFDSNSVSVYSLTGTVRDSAYDNLDSNQDNIEDGSEPVSLSAGDYTATGQVNSGDPVAVLVRFADDYTQQIMQAGCNFHSGPYCIQTTDGVLVAGSSVGHNERVITNIGGDRVVVLDSLQLERPERYHSNLVIAKAGSCYVAFGSDHNREQKGISSQTMAGLATATQHDAGGGANTDTYCNVAVDANEEVWTATRYAGSEGICVNHYPQAADLSTFTRDFVHEDSRLYPVDINCLQKDNGGVLTVLQFQQRAGYWRRPGIIAAFDPTVGTRGQWYNLSGDTVGTTTSGTASTDPRWTLSNVQTDWTSGGLTWLNESGSLLRYCIGPCGVKVGSWNDTRKTLQVAMLWSQRTNNDINAKASTDVGLGVVDGDTRVVAVAPGGDSDPFGVDPTNGYRGPGCVWWDGDDLIVVLADRHERDRTYFYSANNQNLYYDMTGHIIRVFRVSDALSQTTSDDLAAAVTEIGTYSHAALGKHFDTQGQELGVFNIRRLGATNKFYCQVAMNGLDASQEQATVKIFDVDEL